MSGFTDVYIFVSILLCTSVRGSGIRNNSGAAASFTLFFPLSPSPILSLRSLQEFFSKGGVILRAVAVLPIPINILPVARRFRKTHIVPDARGEEGLSPSSARAAATSLLSVFRESKNVSTRPRIAKPGLSSRTMLTVCRMRASPAST